MRFRGPRQGWRLRKRKRLRRGSRNPAVLLVDAHTPLRFVIRDFVIRYCKRQRNKKPFRRGREGFFVFRDPSWSQGQNCWDELGIPFFEVAPEVHQTKITGQTVGPRTRHTRGQPSYFFLVVFFVVFFAVFLAAFFIAMVINHLLSHGCEFKGRAKKSQRISFGWVCVFCIGCGL